MKNRSDRLIRTRHQPGDRERSLMSCFRGFSAVQFVWKPLKRLHISRPLVPRLKPGANERCTLHDRFAVLLVLLFLLLGPLAFAADPIANSECMDCHGDKTLMSTNAAGKVKVLFTDEARIKASVHGTNMCASCHSDLTRQHPDDNVAARPVNCSTCHERQSETYGASVHAIALRQGEKSSATCVDCHGSHEVLPPTSPNSPLHFSKLADTCGSCHDDAARDVALSVHGKSAARGYREAATCTDCHSEHKIEALKATSSLHISKDVCSKCHASEKINTKFRLPRDRVKTFFESYHGMASQYGSTLAAHCGSCHGYHKVLPSTDPVSTIHTNNLVATCGKCHPGATDKFAQGKVHIDIASAKSGGPLGEQVNWWVRKIYIVLIVGVIGGMVAHNGLLAAKKFRAIYRTRERTVLRMNLSQRWQHIVLALSFIVLAITGFALKWPDSWIARVMGSSEPFRRWSHRIAGVVLIAVGLYHVCYLLFTKEGRQLVRDFWPGKNDAKDVADSARYLVGMKKEKPRFGRFGYAEKMEYWAVVWGTIIMGVTGLMVWFKMDVTQYIPRWLVDVALTIHYYEAILACLAIIVWHFYHVVFDPDVYPLNMACVDGRVSEHWQEEEHPLDTQAVKVRRVNGSDTQTETTAQPGAAATQVNPSDRVQT